MANESSQLPDDSIEKDPTTSDKLETVLNNIEAAVSNIESQVDSKLQKFEESFNLKLESSYASIEACMSKTSADLQLIASNAISACENKYGEYSGILMSFTENISSTIEDNYQSVLATYNDLLATVNNIIATIKEYIVELKVTASVYLSSSKELSGVLEQSSNLINALEKSYSQFASLVETIQVKTDKCNTSVTQLQSAIINILQSIKFNAEALDATQMITSITQGVKNIKDTIISPQTRRKL